MRPAVQSIAVAVGNAFGGLTIEDICSRDRRHTRALARMIVLYVARAELGLSYPELAPEVGLKDHTSAMHAVSKISKLIAAGDAIVLAAVEAGERAAELELADPNARMHIGRIPGGGHREFRQPIRPLASIELDDVKIGAAE